MSKQTIAVEEEYEENVVQTEKVKKRSFFVGLALVLTLVALGVFIYTFYHKSALNDVFFLVFVGAAALSAIFSLIALIAANKPCAVIAFILAVVATGSCVYYALPILTRAEILPIVTVACIGVATLCALIGIFGTKTEEIPVYDDEEEMEDEEEVVEEVVAPVKKGPKPIKNPPIIQPIIIQPIMEQQAYAPAQPMAQPMMPIIPQPQPVAQQPVYDPAAAQQPVQPTQIPYGQPAYEPTAVDPAQATQTQAVNPYYGYNPYGYPYGYNPFDPYGAYAVYGYGTPATTADDTQEQATAEPSQTAQLAPKKKVIRRRKK